MKKLFSLIVTVAMVFTIAACNGEPQVRELTRDEYKAIEDEIREEFQEDFDRDLEIAKNELQPVTIYLEGKEIVKETIEVPRELTDEELKTIKDELKRESDIALQYAIDHLEPTIKEVEKIVFKDRDTPIDGEKYEFGYDTCITFVKDGDNLYHLKGIIKPTLIGNLFGANYVIELEEPNASGSTEYSFKDENAYTVCYRIFGDRPTNFDLDYPGFIPTEAPIKKEE